MNRTRQYTLYLCVWGYVWLLFLIRIVLGFTHIIGVEDHCFTVYDISLYEYSSFPILLLISI